MKIEKLHIFLFLLSFVVGCAFIYVSPIEYKTMFVYPTPSNVANLQYKDAVGNCFQFKQKEVECTGDVKSIPSQV